MAKRETESAAIALERFRIRAGLNLSELATGAGYSYASGVQRYLDPNAYTEPYFSLKVTRRFADALVGRGVPPITEEELYLRLAGVVSPEDAQDLSQMATNVSEAGDIRVLSRQSMVQDIPVYGAGAAGDNGDFRFNGETIDYVRRPPGIQNRKGIFAVYAQGDSMAPWRNPGDLVYIDPARPPKPGDHVLIECKGTREGEPGDAYIKKLVAITPTKYILGEYREADKRIEVAKDRVKVLFRVIEWSELLGV